MTVLTLCHLLDHPHTYFICSTLKIKTFLPATARATVSRGTLKNHVTLTRTQGTGVCWRWCGRCRDGSVSRKKFCRRSEYQQANPHTPLLCERRRRRRGWLFLCYCAKPRNFHLQHTSDSRSDRSLQTCSHNCFLSFWRSCNSLL